MGRFAFAGFWLALLIGSAAAADAPQMTVPGTVGVTATGAATYSVPITIPPGTNGLVPHISLNYSSQNGDGVLGIHWSIAGLPTITRCPRTLAQDGVHGGVNYDLNDRFCLNGQRLALVSGTYGADMSVYRTEIDTFAKVIAHGTAGNGPAWFEVREPFGVVEELGNSTDSQILAQGTATARIWALSKAYDVSGNYYTATYMNDTANGQFYPTRIDYTGHSGTPSVMPYNSVQFLYGPRPDITPSYHGGSLMQTTKLLTDVETFNGTSLVNDYRIGYQPGAVPTRLNSIKLCDASSNCLAPTGFGWQGNPATLTPATTIQTFIPSYVGGGPLVFSGDFNGDGLTDIAYARFAGSTCPAGGSLFYATPSSGFVAGGTTIGGADFCPVMGNFSSHIYALDVEGDGFTDLIEDEITTGGFGVVAIEKSTLYRNSRSNVFTSTLLGTETTTHTGSTLSGALAQGGAGDFNGDGLGDFLGFDLSNNILLQIGAGNGTFSPTTYGTSIGGSDIPIADFDGDGCSDFVLTAAMLTCAPAVATFAVLPAPYNTYKAVYGDFNGDGLTDILTFTNGAAGALFLSTGTGWVQQTFAVPTDWGKYEISVGDFNGDGKSDLVLIAPGGTGFYGPGTDHKLFLSTGTGFIPAGTITNSSPGDAAAVVGDWNSDGADDIWLRPETLSDEEITFTFMPNLIDSITNGIGVTTTITYDRLNKNQPFYTKCPNTPTSFYCGDAYPTQATDQALYAVSQITTSNGVGGIYVQNYSYGGAKTDLQGRGFLGFAQITVSDPQTGIVKTTNYRTDFPYAGMVDQQTMVTTLTRNGCVAGTTLQTIANTYSAPTPTVPATPLFVALQQTVASGADCDGTALPTITTAYTYDAYGNTLTTTVARSDGSSSAISNNYTNDTVNWLLGQPTRAATHNIVGPSDITRNSKITPDPATGFITTRSEQPGTNWALTTAYGYDAFGNRDAVTISGAGGGPIQGIATRSSGAIYDANGQFVLTSTDALGHADHFTYDPRSGQVATHTDPNGAVMTTTYDGFGRPLQLAKPDGTIVKFAYTLFSDPNFPNVAFYGDATPYASDGVTQIGPITRAYYDALSRKVIAAAQGFTGSWIFAYSQYDANERLGGQSRPYLYTTGTSQPQASAKFATFTYDDLGRGVLATMPDTSHTVTAYHGLSVTVTDNLGHATTTVKNAEGLVASVTDALSHTTSYVYEAFNNPISATDPVGNVTSNVYDVRGNKISMTDPDMGNWSYSYDSLGELVSQSDAHSPAQVTTLSYDLLERPVQRIEPGLVSNWVYDTATNGIGSLAAACTSSTANPTCAFAVLSKRVLTYDTIGRPLTTTLTIGGANYAYATSYNVTNGQVDTVAYPSGFVAKYVYNSFGYLSQIKNNATAAILYTVNARDAELHLTQGTFGNSVATTNSFDPNTGLLTGISAGTSGAVANFSYTWDTVGSLIYRTDANSHVDERFCYDALDRLTTSALALSTDPGAACAGGTVKSYAYDMLGNITSKTGVGTYTYPLPGAAHPHAVSSIAGTVNGVVNPSYSYDANGNMTSGAARTITPTAFNMVASIVEGGTTVALIYDDGHERITQTSPSGTTTYLNDPVSGAMSEAVVSGGSTTWHDYLRVDGHLIAERNCAGAAPCSAGATMDYFTLDNLDSVAAITNDAGAVVERDAYDPWGLRRNINGTDDPTCSLTSVTTRGFTGHEHMSSVCEINANARVYDPTIGRFLSADTVVSDMSDGQALNRYSYIDNRPVSGTDPTGHVPCFGCTTQCYGDCRSETDANFISLIAAIKANNLADVKRILETTNVANVLSPGELVALIGITSSVLGNSFGGGTSCAQIGAGDATLTGPNTQSTDSGNQGGMTINSSVESVVVTAQRTRDDAAAQVLSVDRPLLGKSVTINILPSVPEDERQDALHRVEAMIANINGSSRTITPAQKEIITLLNGINVFGIPSRSGVHLDTGYFGIDLSELTQWSLGFGSTEILHDIYHYYLYKKCGGSCSVGDTAEREATTFQFSVQITHGAEQREIDYTWRYINDPTALHNRENQPGGGP
jgi:RHS repeat-associated protein